MASLQMFKVKSKVASARILSHIEMHLKLYSVYLRQGLRRPSLNVPFPWIQYNNLLFPLPKGNNNNNNKNNNWLFMALSRIIKSHIDIFASLENIFPAAQPFLKWNLHLKKTPCNIYQEIIWQSEFSLHIHTPTSINTSK